MTARVVNSEADREALIRLIQAREPPFTVEIVNGVRRSDEQNRLQFHWVKEAAEQLGTDVKEERAYCKLHFGVPILRAENELFREKYDRIIRPLPYEQKLDLMGEPIDFPVTRIMTTKQKTKYLDAICRHYAGQGVRLTEPVAA